MEVFLVTCAYNDIVNEMSHVVCFIGKKKKKRKEEKNQ